MNNTTFVMGIVLTMLILFLSLGSHAAQAADMGDVTLQVLETNDPTDIVNDIDLPDVQADSRNDAEGTDSNEDSREDSHDEKHEIEDQVQETHDEIEDDIEDTREDIEDEIDEVEVEHEDPPEIEL